MDGGWKRKISTAEGYQPTRRRLPAVRAHTCGAPAAGTTATSRRLPAARPVAHAHMCGAPAGANHCLATTALATYVRKVCARATRKHTDGFFDFHSDFFLVP